MDKAASLLGVGGMRQNIEKQYHEGATPDRMVGDMAHDAKESLTAYMQDLKKTLKQDLGFGDHKPGTEAFGASIKDIAPNEGSKGTVGHISKGSTEAITKAFGWEQGKGVEANIHTTTTTEGEHTSEKSDGNADAIAQAFGWETNNTLVHKDVDEHLRKMYKSSDAGEKSK